MVKKGAKYWKSNTKQAAFALKTTGINWYCPRCTATHGAIMPQISSPLYFHEHFSVNFNELAFGMAFALRYRYFCRHLISSHFLNEKSPIPLTFTHYCICPNGRYLYSKRKRQG
jgi:hypothetical protein